MKTKFFYSMILLIGLFFAGTTVIGQTTTKTTEKTTTKTTTKKAAPVYTCPMHSEVAMNKPGKCPKCGMALVEKKEAMKEKKEIKKEKEMKKENMEKKESSKEVSTEKKEMPVK